MNIDKTKFDASVHSLLDLLLSNEWPEAAPAFLICPETEADKVDRAQAILEFVDENLTNKNFLDFGCGEGHVAQEASKTAKASVGYDIFQSGSLTWDAPSGCLLTTNFDTVTEKGPYDAVLLYDVLDHVDNVATVLEQLSSVVTQDSKIVVRCHSWMSRHGAHLYRECNKAWIHLVFTPQELELMNLKLGTVQKYYHPIKTQVDWFKNAGFSVVSQDVVKSDVEKFFQKPEIMTRMPLDQFQGKFPHFQMSQSFNDYILKKL